ncbi:MAG: signal peptidase I [Bdellovibrionales bacterium]|nr:signal peptidase I [Bdellovibrionales bacterium]
MRRLLQEYGVVIALAGLSAVLFRFLVLEAYSIPGPAMKPTLLPGDHVLVLKTPYVFGDPIPERGSVVLLAPPEDPDHYYLRRVIGIPGDEVQITGGDVWLNGKRLRLDSSTPPSPVECQTEELAPLTYEICRHSPELEDFPNTKVPPNRLFLVADFRTRVSSPFGSAAMAPLESIRGEAKWIWLSIQPAGEVQALTKDTNEGSVFSRLRFNRIFRKVKS